MPDKLFDFELLLKEIKRLKLVDLSTKLQNKEKELEELTNFVNSKLDGDEKEELELLKETYNDLQQNSNNKLLQKHFERSKKTLSKKLTEKEVQVLLDKQVETTQLADQLKNLQETQLESQIQTLPK